jgi:hypothetical protein
VWYHKGVGATGNGHFLTCDKDNRTDWSSGRLSFFIVNIHYQTDHSQKKRAKQEEFFPRHEHVYHLPLCDV